MAEAGPHDDQNPSESRSLTARSAALDILDAVLVRRQGLDHALAAHRGLQIGRAHV